jgi:hypothetical protein
MRIVVLVGLVDTVDKTGIPPYLDEVHRLSLDVRSDPVISTDTPVERIGKNPSTSPPQKKRFSRDFYILEEHLSTPHMWGWRLTGYLTVCSTYQQAGVFIHK